MKNKSNIALIIGLVLLAVSCEGIDIDQIFSGLKPDQQDTTQVVTPPSDSTEVEIPDHPQPDDPDQPQPEHPDKPDEPDQPDQPDQPDVPGPDQPDVPGPDQPDVPGPDQPDVPGPDQPDVPGPDQPDVPGPDQPDVPGPDQPQTTNYWPSWYEVPSINDADGNRIDDADPDIYYARHSFSHGGREYRNYTVCFSGDHHCPVWVAAPRHSFYSQKNTDRSNAYKADPDIPADLQYKSKSTGSGCNKGHVLGSAERLVSAEANRQVFYYSNIAPQLSAGFNTGGGGWNILEDWVDQMQCADTLYEVIGCYFEKYTDGYGYTVTPKKIEFGGRSDVSFPTMMYYILLRTKTGNSRKALKDCSADELMCAAFVRAHTNDLKGQKPSKKEMMSVADLEKITGYTYFPHVPNAPKTVCNPSDWGL